MRLNAPRGPANHPAATANYEGGLAYRPTPEVELYLHACTGFFGEDRFYTTGQEEHERLLRLIDQVDPLYVLRLADYARNRMYLRTLPQVLLAEAAARLKTPRDGSTVSPVRAYAPRIAIRADEPMEVLAYWIRTRGSLKGFPNALRRGLADAMTRFDAYELAKYDRGGMVRLKDAIQILHPRPRTREQSELFRRALDGTLPPAETWEREVSRHGNRPEVWDRIAPKMGLLALLRNLRNMAKAGSREGLAVALAALRDREHVQKSKILPFRFLAARREIEREFGDTRPEILDALDVALEASAEVVPTLPGTTVVLVDVSGSMESRISFRSRVTLYDIAATLAAILWRRSGARAMAYSTDTAWVDLTGCTILEAADRISRAMDHAGTYAYKAMARLVREDVAADRVVVLSDEQSYGPTRHLTPGQPVRGLLRPEKGRESVAYWWEEYRKRHPKARLWDVDLAGYGTVQFAPDDPSVTFLAGWSEQVLTLIEAVERREEVVAHLSKV